MARKEKSSGIFHVITTSAVDHEFHGSVELVEDHIEVHGDKEWQTWFDNYLHSNPIEGDVLRIRSDGYNGDVVVIDEHTIQTR